VQHNSPFFNPMVEADLDSLETRALVACLGEVVNLKPYDRSKHPPHNPHIKVSQNYRYLCQVHGEYVVGHFDKDANGLFLVAEKDRRLRFSHDWMIIEFLPQGGRQ
jgi:hypothetical protein